MRLIDADALKKHIDKLPALPDGNFAGTHRNLKALINMQPTIEPTVHQWIPCSERLPDKDGRYLVTNNNWGSDEVSWNIWLTNSDQWLYNGNPIAWMEFPEAYRGDEK